MVIAAPGVIERLPPHNLEAEQSVLGSLLIDRDAIIKVASFLKPEDFYLNANGLIYGAVLDLYNRREPTDMITLSDELTRRVQYDQAGGLAYLSSLLSAVPTAVHVEYYARIVERTATLRRLIDAGTQVVDIGFRDGIDTEEALDAAERAIFDVSQRRQTKDWTSMGEVLDKFFDQIDYLQQHRGDVVGVATGYSDMDQMTGGLQRSDLIILAARPSMGKTSLALGMAYGAAVVHKRTVGIFSLEMSAEQLVQRILSMETGVDSHRLRLGQIDDNEWEKISRAFGRLSEAPMYVDDSSSSSIMDVRSKARRLQAEQGLDLIIVDYLQLMSGRRTDNRVQEISEISRGLKQLARELNVPVVALSQLSRAVESRADHRPMLSDLRESGCLTGDTPVFLPDSGAYRPIAELCGQTGFNVLALDSETWKFEPRRVTAAFCTGRKPVYRLQTRLGRTIRATANHQFLTIQGWRRLDGLAVGMRLALPRRLPSPEQSTLSLDELALLGHLIGDGCTLPRHVIQYTTNDPLLAETVVDLAQRVFGDKVVPRIARERSWYQVYLPARDALTHGVRNPIAAWLDQLGVFGLRSHEKRVPDAVFAQPREAIARFLRHLWSTDGCVHLSQGKTHYANVYYATSSPQLARDVQSLLLRLEINATLAQREQPGKGRPQYHVWVSGQAEITRFLDEIGGLGEHKQAHEVAIHSYLGERVANTSRDVVPRDVWRGLVTTAMAERAMTSRQMQAAIGMQYCGTTLYKSNLSRERAARVAEVVASAPLAALALSDVYWDEVVAIEPDGEEEVYDLTVEGLHNFVAGNIVVHNSIEQDADIVMFIYREDKYEEDSEKKGIAEIIVAKHRNGPVGSVNLRFFDRTARFADLELYPGPGM
ncbi:MAG: replicative DNA helicase [Chloroflexota bacterium]|nr:replicative DNA helicase [Chloroflexota bacterium]